MNRPTFIIVTFTHYFLNYPKNIPILFEWRERTCSDGETIYGYISSYTSSDSIYGGSLNDFRDEALDGEVIIHYYGNEVTPLVKTLYMAVEDK